MKAVERIVEGNISKQRPKDHIVARLTGGQYQEDNAARLLQLADKRVTALRVGWVPSSYGLFVCLRVRYITNAKLRGYGWSAMQ